MDVLDRKSPGRPVEIADDHQRKLEKIVMDNRRISKKDLAEKLNVSHGNAVSLLTELGIRKPCSRFVPYFLTAEMCERRLQCCNQLLELFNDWAHLYWPTSSEKTRHHCPSTCQRIRKHIFINNSNFQQSQRVRNCVVEQVIQDTWCSPSSGTFAVLSTWILLSDHSDWMLNIIVNNFKQHAKVFANQETRNSTSFRTMRPSTLTLALARQSQIVVKNHKMYFLIQRTVRTWLPVTFICFGIWSTTLEGQRFVNTEDVKSTVIEFFNSRILDFFSEAFQELLLT